MKRPIPLGSACRSHDVTLAESPIIKSGRRIHNVRDVLRMCGQSAGNEDGDAQHFAPCQQIRLSSTTKFNTSVPEFRFPVNQIIAPVLIAKKNVAFGGDADAGRVASPSISRSHETGNASAGSPKHHPFHWAHSPSRYAHMLQDQVGR